MEHIHWVRFSYNGRMGRTDYWLNAYSWRVVEPVEGFYSSGSRNSEASLSGKFVGVLSR